MHGILGKKIGMTRIIRDGVFVPVTLVYASPNEVLQVKTPEKDGYSAITLGFDSYGIPRKTKKYKFIKEVRVTDSSQFALGQKVSLEDLGELGVVVLTGWSKGRGFQGNVRRHNYSTLRKTHGTKYPRHGSTMTTARSKGGGTKKGLTMPGHMGGDTVTTRDRSVVLVDTERHVYAVKGAIPGAVNGYVILRKSS